MEITSTIKGPEHEDILHGNHEFLDKNQHPEVAMKKIKTAGSISIDPDLFEKLYLAPQNQAKGGLTKTFGNPTPIGILGFIISLGPLSCDLMGWRGAGGGGAASIPTYIFFGGMLLTLGGLLEFFLGNTFPCLVFLAFGAFYLSFGGTLLPQFNAYAAYAPPDAESPAAGLATQGFNASFGFFTLSMMILCLVFLVGSVRTNVSFFIVFLSLVLTFALITGAYWALASDYTGNAASANRLLVGAGACAFIATAVGWWIFLALLLASVDFPISLPLGDLSTVVRGAGDRKKGEV
ncbi:hypothetical protein F4779DRAFT_615680 [Xylariaceae sp. FL0662B]|nr:hypothetical protein F4779DRAFT_615680 [Xylariaceae sp. FL0662B]